MSFRVMTRFEEPRPEQVILNEVRRVEDKLVEMDGRDRPFREARATIEAALPGAESALADSDVEWAPPVWLPERDRARAVEHLKWALNCLRELEAKLDSEATAVVPGVLVNLDPAVAWGRGPTLAAEREAAQRRLSELATELELARQGPGEPKRYRLLRGSHTRWENGAFRRYRPGAIIELDGWQAMKLADCLGSRVEPAEDEAQAATG